MKILLPISFLRCTIEVSPSPGCAIVEKTSQVLAHMIPHIRRIRLLWDDPSIFENLASLIAAIDDREIPFDICTSGRWSDSLRFLREISQSPFFSTLVFSNVDERLLDDRSDFFQNLSASMHSARSLGIPLRTETPIDEGTESCLEEIFERASLMGATEFSLRRQPGAFGDNLSHYKEKNFRIFSRLETFMKEGWSLLLDDCMPLCSSAAFSHFCGAGITTCHIDAKGRVYPCRYSSEELGNIIGSTLHHLYLAPRSRRWRKSIIDECGSCPAFAVCKGGCRHMGKALGISHDPLCDPEALPKRKEYSRQIKLSENACVLPRFEMRRGDEAWVITREHLFLVLPLEMEKFLSFLLTEPTLGDVVRSYSPDSLGTLFELYERGFLAFKKKKGRKRKAPDEEDAQGFRKGARQEPSLINFNENLLLKLSSELRFIHKGNKVLVIHPESASWRCINAMDFYNIQYFREPTYVAEFLKEHVWMPEVLLKPMVTNFYKAGFIEINGLNFWNSPSREDPGHAMPLQFILKTDGLQREIMDLSTAKKIVEAIQRHYGNERKIIELRMEGSGEASESWLMQFLREPEIITALQESGTILSVLFSAPHVPEAVFEVLGKYAAVIEIEAEATADIAGTAREAREHGIMLIARLPARTPVMMRALFKGVKDTGVSAVRLEPLYDTVIAPNEWVALYMEILQEAMDRVAEEKPLLLIKELDCLIRSLITRRRTHPCYRHPCGAGSQRVSFDWKGAVYPCVSMIPDEKFNCGPVSPDISPRDALSKNAALRSYRSTNDAIRCKECHWRHFCPINCPGERDGIRAGIKGPDPRCGLYQLLFEELCWKIDRNPTAIKKLYQSSLF
jgi:radical SAM protein with 4Fe4S-binding SPASM domain